MLNLQRHHHLVLDRDIAIRMIIEGLGCFGLLDTSGYHSKSYEAVQNFYDTPQSWQWQCVDLQEIPA